MTTELERQANAAYQFGQGEAPTKRLPRQPNAVTLLEPVRRDADLARRRRRGNPIARILRQRPLGGSDTDRAGGTVVASRPPSPALLRCRGGFRTGTTHQPMLIHHLNCGSLCPLMVGAAVCHCLIVETSSGLLLVDTGLGSRLSERPDQYMPAPLRRVLRPAFDPAEALLAQLQRLGYSPNDVRHIVLTHLDLDHAGGILDFPHAVVHVHADELRAARSPRGPIWHWRYRKPLLQHSERFQLYAPGAGELWYGFRGVRQLEGLPPELLLVPLPGHTAGHCGVAIQTGGGWLVHAGDAYLAPGAVDYRRGRPHVALRLAQRITALDESRRRESEVLLAHLVSQNQARVFCSHSPSEFQRWQRQFHAASPEAVQHGRAAASE